MRLLCRHRSAKRCLGIRPYTIINCYCLLSSCCYDSTQSTQSIYIQKHWHEVYKTDPGWMNWPNILQMKKFNIWGSLGRTSQLHNINWKKIVSLLLLDWGSDCGDIHIIYVSFYQYLSFFLNNWVAPWMFFQSPRIDSSWFSFYLHLNHSSTNQTTLMAC